MRLILVRHGQTHSNITHALDTGYPGAALTELGQQQATRLASDLAAERVDVVAASMLLRARQTAAPLAAARGRTVLICEGLREIGAGDLEMRTDRESIKTYRDAMVSWATGDLDVRMPGGPSGHEYLAGYDEAVAAIESATAKAVAGGAAAGGVMTNGASAGDVPTAVAVSHGAAIRVWVAIRCAGIDIVETARNNLVNTGLFIIEGSTADGWHFDRRIDPLEDPSPLPVD